MSTLKLIRLERADCAVAGAVILMFSLGSLYPWSVFVQPLEDELAVSRSAVSRVFSLATVGFTAFMLIGPLFYRFAGAPMIALMPDWDWRWRVWVLLYGPSNSVTAVCSASPTV